MKFKQTKQILSTFLMISSFSNAYLGAQEINLREINLDSNNFNEWIRNYTESRKLENALGVLCKNIYDIREELVNGKIDKIKMDSVCKSIFISLDIEDSRKTDIKKKIKSLLGSESFLEQVKTKPWKAEKFFYNEIRKYLDKEISEELIESQKNAVKILVKRDRLSVYSVFYKKGNVGGVEIGLNGEKDGFAYLNQIFINKNAQSQGLGNKTLDKIKEIVKLRKLKGIKLEAERKSLEGYYEKNGFKKTENDERFLTWKC